MTPLKLNLIAACDAQMGIGLKNTLPWRLKKEMAYFNRMTTGSLYHPGSDSDVKMNVVLMGRKTFDSIPDNFKPLKNRLNMVLTRNSELNLNKNIITCKSWEDAMQNLSERKKRHEIGDIWVVGGSYIYKLALESPFCHRIYLTKLTQQFDCDTFFPSFDENNFTLVKDPNVPEGLQEENNVHYTFHVYEKLSR